MSSDDDHNLENELARLRPRRLSPALRESIRGELARGGRRWWRPVLAAAAVLAVVMGGVWFSGGMRHQTVAERGKVWDTKLILATLPVATQDEEVMATVNKGQMCRVRRRVVDYAQWYDRGRVYAMTIPREEVRLVPLETY